MDTHTIVAMKPTTKKQIVGKKIIDCWLIEESDENFTAPLVVIQLENGVELHAQGDDEFNDVGIMVAMGIPKKETVYLNYEGVKKK